MCKKQWVISAACLAVLSAGSARAGIEGLTQVASGLSSPMFTTFAPGDPTRLFIVERGGNIRILHLDTGVLDATPFLTVPSVATAGEGGFRGLAFSPGYSDVGSPGFGKFYVNVTIANGGDTSLGTVSPFSVHVLEYSVSANPNLANVGSKKEVISWVQPQDNHNAGWIGFSPANRYLYIATGDGGGGDDTGAGHTAGTGNAQDITNQKLGKMLRIDVNGDDFTGAADSGSLKNYRIPKQNPFVNGPGDPEIMSYGLRNPFRDSFDRQNANLWIGDVGQGQREEIDFQSATSAGGENYGWRLREGLIQNPTAGIGGAPPPGNVNPVYDYAHAAGSFGGVVVSGGYIYRGPDPSVAGKYFLLDSRNTSATSDDNYWTFDPANPTGTVSNINTLLTPDVGTKQFPVSFGEDAAGNLYIMYLISGEVYRIRTTAVGSNWNVNADGNWSGAGNWAGAVPNAVDATANFGFLNTAPRTVTLDTPITAGTVSFNSAFAYSLGGTSTLTMDATAGLAVIKSSAGLHTISAPVVLNDNLLVDCNLGGAVALTGNLSAAGRTITKVGGGTAQFENVRAAALNVQVGTVRISAKPTPDASGTSVVQSLTINTFATLDLTNNSMIIDYTGPVGTLVGDTRQHLLAGRLTTTSGTGLIGLGYVDNAALSTVKTSFAGQSVDASSLLIKYTYFGDTDLDGDVDVDDLGNLALAWQTSNVWAGGDFDYNGIVNVNDLSLLALNWQAGVGSPLGPESLIEALAALGLPNVSVPEPASLSVAGLAMAAIGLRRRRRLARIAGGTCE